MTALITAKDLKDRLDKVKILDATYPPVAGDENVIPGGRPFDIDEVADLKNPMPHMLPSPEFFEHKMRKMSINNSDEIIIYDQQGMAMAAARAWWMFRVFGHDNVKILDGGRPQWILAGYELETRDEKPVKPGDFSASFRPKLVKSAKDVLKNLQTPRFELIDVRNRARFDQEGHIPKSKNLFFMNLIDLQEGTLRDKDALRQEFDKASVSLENPAILSCGSGVTACVGALALYELGFQDAAVYDGSWTEWSARGDLPKEQTA